MIKSCHRCSKSVYPVEKLDCLDKTWHKGCFNCEVCHMSLSMKTYKGYHKLPYCAAHYPTTKFTAVADTPEQMRLNKTTKNQSGIAYTSDFVKEKGKFTTTTETPESARIAKAQENASDLKYTGVYDRKGSQSYPEPIAPQQPAPQPQRVPQQYQPEPEPVAPPEPVRQTSNHGPTYVAIYDYTAADDDEVSFSEGDIIVNGEIIDDGWMTGTVARTGETGMLPSNYVEQQ